MLILAGCAQQTTPTPPIENNSLPSGEEVNLNQTNTPANDLTWELVNQHNTADNCWQVIDNQIYDLSQYIKLGIHPGGTDKLINLCGQDATTAFRNVGKHQEQAQQALTNYILGTLLTP